MENKRKFESSSSNVSNCTSSNFTDSISSVASDHNDPWAILVPVNEFTAKSVGTMYLLSSYNTFGKNPTCNNVNNVSNT